MKYSAQEYLNIWFAAHPLQEIKLNCAGRASVDWSLFKQQTLCVPSICILVHVCFIFLFLFSSFRIIFCMHIHKYNWLSINTRYFCYVWCVFFCSSHVFCSFLLLLIVCSVNTAQFHCCRSPLLFIVRHSSKHISIVTCLYFSSFHMLFFVCTYSLASSLCYFR